MPSAHSAYTYVRTRAHWRRRLSGNTSEFELRRPKKTTRVPMTIVDSKLKDYLAILKRKRIILCHIQTYFIFPCPVFKNALGSNADSLFNASRNIM